MCSGGPHMYYRRLGPLSQQLYVQVSSRINTSAVGFGVTTPVEGADYTQRKDRTLSMKPAHTATQNNNIAHTATHNLAHIMTHRPVLTHIRGAVHCTYGVLKLTVCSFSGELVW